MGYIPFMRVSILVFMEFEAYMGKIMKLRQSTVEMNEMLSSLFELRNGALHDN